MKKNSDSTNIVLQLQFLKRYLAQCGKNLNELSERGSFSKKTKIIKSIIDIKKQS